MQQFVVLLGVAFITVLPVLGQGLAAHPAVIVSFPNYHLPGTADDACSVDYGNMKLFGEDRQWKAHLRNGKYEQKFNFGYQAAELKRVYCIDEGSDKYAVIFVDWTDCGGSCLNTGVVQLIKVRAASLVVIQQFTFDSHAVGTGATFDKKSRVLSIIGRSDDGSPNCCAQNFDVVEFRWQGQKFIRQRFKRIPAPQEQSGK